MFLVFLLRKKLNRLNLILLTFAMVLGWLLFADHVNLYSYSKDAQKVTPVIPTATPTLIPTPTEIPMPRPLIIGIPKLGIQADIDYVGVDENGAMEVPSTADRVAWFRYGYKPGEKGNAAIAGHYDNESGGPAIFFNLSKLEVGDEIYVQSEDGSQRKFIVTRKENYDLDTIPIDQIFEKSDKAKLNLITCAGWFNGEIRSYSQRIVVYTEMVE